VRLEACWGMSPESTGSMTGSRCRPHGSSERLARGSRRHAPRNAAIASGLLAGPLFCRHPGKMDSPKRPFATGSNGSLRDSCYSARGGLIRQTGQQESHRLAERVRFEWTVGRSEGRLMCHPDRKLT